MHKMRPMIALLLATFMAISGVPTEFSPDDTSQVIEAQEETGSDMDEPEGLGLEEESSTSDSADEKAEVDVIEQTDNDGISEGTEDPVTTEGVADTEESGDMFEACDSLSKGYHKGKIVISVILAVCLNVLLVIGLVDNKVTSLPIIICAILVVEIISALIVVAAVLVEPSFIPGNAKNAGTCAST